MNETVFKKISTSQQKDRRQALLKAIDVDLNEIKKANPTNSYRVVYYIWTDPNPEQYIPQTYDKCRKIDSVCFAELKTAEENRICYIPVPKLSPEEQAEWIKLCQDNALLPKNLLYEAGTYSLKMDDFPRSLVYIYLTNIRVMDEESAIPRATMMLVKKYGIHPLLALVYAVRMVGVFSIHLYLPCSADYTATPTRFLDLDTVIGLKACLADPTKHFTKSYFGAVDTVKQIGHKLVTTMGLHEKMIASKYMTSHRIMRMLSSSDAKEHLVEFFAHMVKKEVQK